MSPSKTLFLSIPILFLFNSSIFSQTSLEDQSRIEYTTSNSPNEFNLIKVKLDFYESESQLKDIKTKLLNNQHVKSFDLDLVNGYVYIKYNNEITPNEILKVFYENKTKVHYKEGETLIQYQETY